MNFQGIKATVPPRILFKQKSDLDRNHSSTAKNYFSGNCQAMAPPALCPKTCLLSSFMAPAPPAR